MSGVMNFYVLVSHSECNRLPSQEKTQSLNGEEETRLAVFFVYWKLQTSFFSPLRCYKKTIHFEFYILGIIFILTETISRKHDKKK